MAPLSPANRRSGATGIMKRFASTQLVREAPMTRTESAVASMLTENTGRHFLDSGDHYGRNWQRNQGREFSTEPCSVLKFSQYGSDKDGWKICVEVEHNVYHWLVGKLTWDEEANRALAVFERYLRMKTRDEYNYYELADGFPEFFGKWKARRDEV